MRATIWLAGALSACAVPSGWGEMMDLAVGPNWVADCGVAAGRYALDSVLAEGPESCVAGASWGWVFAPDGAQLAAPSAMRGCPVRLAVQGCSLEFAVECEGEAWAFSLDLESGQGAVGVSKAESACRYESRLHELEGEH